MDKVVSGLLTRGVADSTLATYESGKRCYLAFCSQFHLAPLPIIESTLCRFVAFLATSVCYQSIKSYLSAIRHLQITSGGPDPALSSFAQLDYVLKGVRRSGQHRPKRNRLPISPEILCRILQVWTSEPLTFNRTMLWAAFCLRFFGFMRAGEFTCPSYEVFSPLMLSPMDVQVDSHTSPTRMSVHLRQSKTDQFGAGTTIHLGTTGSPLCPVTAILGYLALRPPSPGPLFMYQDGSTLSRERLVQSLREALRAAGVEDSGFSGHSFRIGAATAAAQAGVSDSLIQTLGRWKSSAFTLYIRTPWQHLTSISPMLVAHHDN